MNSNRNITRTCIRVGDRTRMITSSLFEIATILTNVIRCSESNVIVIAHTINIVTSWWVILCNRQTRIDIKSHSRCYSYTE